MASGWFKLSRLVSSKFREGGTRVQGKGSRPFSFEGDGVAD